MWREAVVVVQRQLNDSMGKNFYRHLPGFAHVSYFNKTKIGWKK
jgi:hypothetical protein